MKRPRRVLTPEAAPTYSARHLRRFTCAWCDQRLDRAVRHGQCASIYHPTACAWAAPFRAAQRAQHEPALTS